MYVLSRTQKDISKAAGEFAKGEFDSDQARQMEQEGRFPRGLWKKAGDLGFIGVHYPEQDGGAGLGLLEQLLVQEAWCMRDPSLGLALSMGSCGAEGLLQSGKDRERLSALTSGDIVTASCRYDPEQSEGEGIDPDKVLEFPHVLNCREADLFFVPWQDPRSDGSKRCMVILPAEKARISAESRTGFLGLNLCPPARVGFQLRDLEQADRVQVGTLSKLQRTLNQVFLLQIAGSCLGLAQGALDRALNYAGQREQFGRKIGSFPAIRRKLARMTVKVAESRLMVYHGAACFDRGGLKDQDAAMIKLQAAETARDVADESIQILGGYGYMREYDVERFCREAKACEILGGRAGSQLDAVASGFSKKAGLK